MLPQPSGVHVTADMAQRYYAALPPERTAYYLARWAEASTENPGPDGDKFRWHLAILEDLTGAPPTSPRPGTQYQLF